MSRAVEVRCSWVTDDAPARVTRCGMSTCVREVALGLVCASLTGIAIAQQTAPPPASATHGAATTEAQQSELGKLALSADGAKPPPTLDAAAWQAVIPQDNALDAKRIALGRKLYFEKALSA